MRAAIAARWMALLAVAERRLPALTRLKGAEPLPIALHRRRIYVLPTRFGLTYSCILIVMLLGALNYSNNPAMLLTCLLGAAAYQSVFTAFRTLNRIELRAIRARPCHAGETLRLELHFEATRNPRRALRLRMEGTTAGVANSDEIIFDIAQESHAIVAATIPALRRGWQTIGRIRVWSEYPFGLFHVWSWLHPQFSALIYPRVEQNPPPLPESGGGASAATVQRAGDEFSMLRDYHAADPRRLIAWKASARHDKLLVKEFDRPRSRETVIAWTASEGLDQEARISRMAAWVELAAQQRIAYSLHLPAQRIGPGLGADHEQACLRALAMMPGAGE
jgi:uncharacterized protein (DUF58 family)